MLGNNNYYICSDLLESIDLEYSKNLMQASA